MDTPPSRARPTTVLARLTATIAEDPFGAGDPLEVARLVRRTLAAARHKALDVTTLIVVADAPVPADALARFARRALGPHGTRVASRVASVAAHLPHAERIGLGLDLRPDAGGGISVVLVIGPDDVASAVCAATAGPFGRSGRGWT